MGVRILIAYTGSLKQHVKGEDNLVSLANKRLCPGWGDGFLATLVNRSIGTNFAHSGATTASFVAGGYWAKVLNAVKENKSKYHPYVTIQVIQPKICRHEGGRGKLTASSLATMTRNQLREFLFRNSQQTWKKWWPMSDLRGALRSVVHLKHRTSQSSTDIHTEDPSDVFKPAHV